MPDVLTRFDTHEVTNQPSPLAGLDLFSSDRALCEAVEREGGGWDEARLQAFGSRLGQAETLGLGDLANRHPPVLHSHDRFGHRIDEIEFHPAWHELLGLAVAERVHALPWVEPRPGATVVRAALFHLLNQVEAGVCCPIAMTYAGVAALHAAPALAEAWLPKITAEIYDRGLRPLAGKKGVLVGMALTEKHGGSDLRANSTRAEPAGDGAFALTGHKWFCSAPMSDAFLTLAQTGAGLSCFLLPRVLADGQRNAFRIQRLKDKLGNRANASAEVEYAGAIAWPVGAEGEGVRTIVRMVNLTRLDCAIGSAALMRRALAEALHHAANRSAFQRRLLDQPLMRAVLADLALESEAATALVMRLARAVGEADGDPEAAALARIGTAIAKFWVTKRAPAMIAEALEALGGNGYVEAWPLARLYREAPVNAIWEGSGNVVALDVLRAMQRQPATVAALRAELAPARGADRRFDARLSRLEHGLAGGEAGEADARRLLEDMALLWQGALLLRHAPPPVADAFCAARLGEEARLQPGGLPSGLDHAAISARAMPDV